jgi:dTDP-4-amino-4,6-dideoxygalactose transaminase
MSGYRIPFNKPAVLGNEYAYMADSVSRGHISGDGVYTRKCQELLERELGVPRALLTTSCTHALEMCALLLDIRPGDEVIVPSFTFVSTVNAFVLRGARPVFADIRPDTLNIDERLLDSLITPRTRAIVVVHYAGVGCEMDAILKIARRHGVPVIEDNAHGLFGLYKGRPLGTFGVLATQSFHETKNLYCGEGGALLINDPALTCRSEILREKGTNRSAFFRGEVDKYTWVDVGSSYVMSDSLAAFLYAQLEQRERIQAARKRVWGYYAERLGDWAERHEIGLPYVPPWCDQAFHMFYLLMPSCEARQGLIDHLKRKGILSVFHYVPLHASPLGMELGGRPGQCPVTELVSDTLVRLPFYNDLTEELQAEVVRAIEEFTVPAESGTLAQLDRYIRAENGRDLVAPDLESLAQACEDPAQNRIESPVHK